MQRKSSVKSGSPSKSDVEIDIDELSRRDLETLNSTLTRRLRSLREADRKSDRGLGISNTGNTPLELEGSLSDTLNPGDSCRVVPSRTREADHDVVPDDGHPYFGSGPVSHVLYLRISTSSHKSGKVELIGGQIERDAAWGSPKLVIAYTEGKSGAWDFRALDLKTREYKVKAGGALVIVAVGHGVSNALQQVAEGLINSPRLNDE